MLYKKKKKRKRSNNRLKVEGRNKHGFRITKWSWHFNNLYMYVHMAFAITQWKSHIATKNAASSGHRPNFATPCFGVSLPTDRSGVSFLTYWPSDWRPSSFSSSLAGFRGHGSLCGLRAKVDKEVPLDTLTPVKDAEDKIPSLATHPRTHRETHT